MNTVVLRFENDDIVVTHVDTDTIAGQSINTELGNIVIGNYISKHDAELKFEDLIELSNDFLCHRDIRGVALTSEEIEYLKSEFYKLIKPSLK